MGNIASPKILSPRSLATAVAVGSVGGRGARERECGRAHRRSVGWSAGRPDERGAVFAASSAAAAVSCMSLTLSNEERLHQRLRVKVEWVEARR